MADGRSSARRCRCLYSYVRGSTARVFLARCIPAAQSRPCALMRCGNNERAHARAYCQCLTPSGNRNGTRGTSCCVDGEAAPLCPYAVVLRLSDGLLTAERAWTADNKQVDKVNETVDCVAFREDPRARA